eukprot:scaffold18570_cov136-Isochrysis_galbana.AAC.1
MPAPALRRSAHPVTWLLLACACPSGAGAVMPLPTRPTRAPLIFAAARPGRWRFGHLPPVACEQPRLPQSGGSTGSVPPRGKSTVRTSSDRAGARKRAPQQHKPTVVGSAALGAPERPTRRSESFLRNFLPALVLFFWVRTCVVEPFFIPSLSMVPTLTPNDQIAVEKFSKIWVSSPSTLRPPQGPTGSARAEWQCPSTQRRAALARGCHCPLALLAPADHRSLAHGRPCSNVSLCIQTPPLTPDSRP